MENNISEIDLLKQIQILNSDNTLDGYIVQLPLPKHIDEEKILLAIDSKKDVDGFHPENLAVCRWNWMHLFQQHLMV